MSIIYEEKTGRYRDTSTGRFASSSEQNEDTIDRFSSVLKSIDASIIKNIQFSESILSENIGEVQSTEKTNELLQRIIDLQVDQAENLKENQEDLKRALLLKDIEEPQNQTIPYQEQPVYKQRGITFGNILFADILGDFIASAIGAVAGLSVAGIASKILKGGFRGAVGFIIGSFLENVIEESLVDLGTDQEIADSVGASFKKATIWAAIGSIFGRRFAVIAGVGGLLSKSLENLLDQNEDGVIEAFGKEWDAGTVAGIGSLLASAFGYSLIKKGITSALFTGGAGAAAAGAGKLALKPSLITKFTKGFRLKFGAAAIMSIAGELLGSAITEATGNEKVGDAISTTAQFAAVGAMLGPKGALIGAIAGIAFTGANWLYNWFMKKNSEVDDRLKERVDNMEVDEIVKGAGDIAEGMVGGASSGEAYADIVGSRLKDAGYGDLISQAQSQADPMTGNIPTVISEALYKKADDSLNVVEKIAENGISAEESSQVRNIVEKLQLGLAGINSLPESSSRNELISYYKDTIKEIAINPVDFIDNKNPIYDNKMFDMKGMTPSINSSISFVPSSSKENVKPKYLVSSGSLLEGKSILAQKTEQIVKESTNINTAPRPVVVRGGDALNAPVTNNSSQTTVINNSIEPSRSLNHVPN